MSRGRRRALGAATALLVLCYAGAVVSFVLPWSTAGTDGTGSDEGGGGLLGFSSLYLAMLLTAVLLCVYLGVVLSRSDWSWPRKAGWAVLFWALAPVAMPVYFLRHI